MYKNGHNDLDSHTSIFFTVIITNSVYDPTSFLGFSEEDVPVVEEILQSNILFYSFDLQEGEDVGELAQQSIGRVDKTVKLMRSNNHLIFTKDIDRLTKRFGFPGCDHFFSKSYKFNKHLLRCKDRVRHVYPNNVFELSKILFDKLKGFNLLVSEDERHFKKLAIFDLESFVFLQKN